MSIKIRVCTDTTPLAGSNHLFGAWFSPLSRYQNLILLLQIHALTGRLELKFVLCPLKSLVDNIPPWRHAFFIWWSAHSSAGSRKVTPATKPSHLFCQKHSAGEFLTCQVSQSALPLCRERAIPAERHHIIISGSCFFFALVTLAAEWKQKEEEPESCSGGRERRLWVGIKLKHF